MKHRWASGGSLASRGVTSGRAAWRKQKRGQGGGKRLGRIDVSVGDVAFYVGTL